jgi:hypothetical protein
MGQITKLAAIFSVASVVAACASGPEKVRVDEMKGADLGAIYGQLILPNEEWHMVRLVMIQRVGKVYAGMGLQGLSERVHSTRDGRFVAANLTPGKYMLAGFVIGADRNFLGKSALNYTVDVKPGGLQYMGSYKYTVTKSSNMIRPGSFDLEPEKSSAAHAQLLGWVEEATRETRWHAKVQKELANVRKTPSRTK